MIETIERSKIEEALKIAEDNRRSHENEGLSEAYIAACTAVRCFRFVLSLCKPLNTTNETNSKNSAC